MKAATTAPRPFTGWHMLAVMVAFFGVVIGVNVTLAVLANRTWSGLIVANGYDASQAYGKEEAREKAQALLGWQAGIIHENGVLTVSMRSKDGLALTGLQMKGTLRRVVTDSEDHMLVFAEAGNGAYSAPARIAPGQWELEVDANDGKSDSFIQTYRFIAKGD